MSLIEVSNVSKVFNLSAGRKLFRHQVADMFRPRREEDYFHALKNVSFTVERGESVALIGANGAGKSTILGLVAGLAEPSKGTVKVDGPVAALLELGSGFHPDLTGKENVFVNASLLGYSEQKAKDSFESIVKFADIGDFINEPVRTYSSGMMIRLAFAVAVHVDPAVLIVDEVLAVGDARFQEKCHRHVAEMRKHKLTMLCVSHSPATINVFCDRAIWLDRGEIVMDGKAASVTEAYARYMNTPGAMIPSRGVHLVRPPAAAVR